MEAVIVFVGMSFLILLMVCTIVSQGTKLSLRNSELASERSSTSRLEHQLRLERHKIADRESTIKQLVKRCTALTGGAPASAPSLGLPERMIDPLTVIRVQTDDRVGVPVDTTLVDWMQGDKNG